MKKNMFSEVVVGSLMSASLLAGTALSSTANADTALPPQDLMVTTIIDKSWLVSQKASDRPFLLYQLNTLFETLQHAPDSLRR